MKTVHFHQVDAFTTEPLTGNAAGVVPEADGLTVAEMQSIARELNNSETAFLLAPEGDDHQVRVRFFTPTMEVPSCGHATIAAHYVRAVGGRLPDCEYNHKIGIGVLPVGIAREDGDYKVIMTQGPPEFGDPIDTGESASVLAALGLERSDVDEQCPVQVVSTGHSKVMVGIRSLERLHRLEPDQRALIEASRRLGPNGFYVFVRTEGEFAAHGRMFAPAIGIAEDPVTGNANGPLGAYLVRHGLARPKNGVVAFRARQGEAMGRPGTVDVTVSVAGSLPVRVQVAGRAVIVFTSEMRI